MRLEHTVALITGAGSGIGRALAVHGAARGMRLILVGRREQALAQTRDLAAGAVCELFPCDVTSATDRERLVQYVAARAGNIGLLVNNAGVVHCGSLESCDDEALQRLVATNVMAPMALTRVLLPLLRKAPQARVLNVGSMFGDIAFPHFAAYSATKFALRGFSDALRRELAGHGIGVTHAAPRAVRTPAAHGFAHLIGPMKMRLDAPDDVARAMLDAVARDARSLYPRGLEQLFVLVQRLLPAVIDRSLSGIAASLEKATQQAAARAR